MVKSCKTGSGHVLSNTAGTLRLELPGGLSPHDLTWQQKR